MTRVCMIEYQGRCDEQQNAVGHAPKVLEEYYSYLKDVCDVSVMAPKVILKEVPSEVSKNAKVLVHNIVMKAKPSFSEKILNKFRMFANIASAFHHSESDILWFYNVEYYLMLYLILHKKSDKKVVCTLFQEGFQNGKFGWMKQKIFHAAQKKMDLIITSGRKFSFPNAKSIYIPDYCYKEENYKPYRIKAEEKKNMAVCLGTMGAGKELDEMVEAFGRIGFPLTVAGRFYDKELLNRLKDKAKDNIVFRDEYLSKEEYFSLLATAKYTVLPYSPEKYGTQTSGVLQEAVFLDTIPISYEAVLEGNEIPGVTFSKWEDLTPERLEEKQEWLSEYDRLRKQVYGEENIKKQYYSIFKEEDLQ